MSTANLPRIGLVGAGIMGKPMSKNLLKAGYSLVVCDRNPETVAEVMAAGAEAASTAKAIAEQCEVIITMLPNSPHVKEVALGENGIIEGAKPGTVLIDMSSIAPLASREISEALKAKGVDMLDAPVSGGEPKAIDGTLSVMVGGDKAIFDKYYDLMKAMAGSVVHTGDIGAGNVTKLANQVIVALNIAAMSEALTLATKAGVNPDLVYQAIRGGLAGSTVLDAKAPMLALHDHNEQQRAGVLIQRIQQGQSIALISDAGTPLISDPGYHLVKACRDAGVKVVPLPGPCAAITALSAAGLPTDRFVFEGFLPAKEKGKEDRLQALADETRTMVFYESPRRVVDTLESMYAAIMKHILSSESRQDPYSVATIYSYLYHKEHEVNRLIIALECVRYRISADEAMQHIAKT